VNDHKWNSTEETGRRQLQPLARCVFFYSNKKVEANSNKKVEANGIKEAVSATLQSAATQALHQFIKSRVKDKIDSSPEMRPPHAASFLRH